MKFVGIIVLALVVRGGVVLSNLDQFDQDPDAYRVIAETLSQTRVFGLPATIDPGNGTVLSAKPTAFRPPLYPYLLSWLTVDHHVHRVLVGLLHLGLGVLTAVCTLSIASRLIDGGRYSRASILAAVLVIIDPILLQQSTLVMTETIAAALATLCVWFWVCRWMPSPTLAKALIFAVLLALAYLCRPTFLVWAVLMLPAILFSTQICWIRRLACTFSAVTIMVLVVGLWTVRNQIAVGHPVWATSHGGYTLLLANNPSFYDYLRHGKFGEAWDAEPFLETYQHRFQGDPTSESFWQTDWSDPTAELPPARSLSEHEDDQWSYQAAKATIAREPSMFVWSCFVRLGRLWSPMPHHVAGRSWPPIVIVTLYYLAFWFATIVGLYRIGRVVLAPSWWAIIALVITLSAVHSIYWSNLRMRSPMIPSLAVIAAAGFVRPRIIKPLLVDQDAD
ncbi:transmembrane protein [Rhodopirellula maiorica SM1]|uniref:Transmembrane protein n=2 Tax=Novipirellula TaxID=2795426 RepID=M5RFB6_9BACT|nr:transmembrane protein [Rhodopirellula maiorica SM1]